MSEAERIPTFALVEDQLNGDGHYDLAKFIGQQAAEIERLKLHIKHIGNDALRTENEALRRDALYLRESRWMESLNEKPDAYAVRHKDGTKWKYFGKTLESAKTWIRYQSDVYKTGDYEVFEMYARPMKEKQDVWAD